MAQISNYQRIKEKRNAATFRWSFIVSGKTRTEQTEPCKTPLVVLRRATDLIASMLADNEITKEKSLKLTEELKARYLLINYKFMYGELKVVT